MTDAEWAIVAPLLPRASNRGRHRRWKWRKVLDAIFYVLRLGCP
jgi:transposase